VRKYETACTVVGKKWGTYSGLFILLKQRVLLAKKEVRRLLR
jgi:hypothetical protein